MPPPFRAPQPEIAPDLDMRPGEPARSTLSKWVVTCRSCGATAPDLGTLPAEAAACVRAEAYRALLGQGQDPIAPFRRWAAICAAVGDRKAAAEALLQAAWMADDRDDAGQARDLRSAVAALWAEAVDTETRLRRIDVQRRAGDFEAARTAALAMAGHSLDETARSILAFQQRRIEAADAGRYLISSALPPPAHAPHVTHVRQRKSGLLARMFGRA